MTNQELYNSLFQYDNGRLIRKTNSSNTKIGDIAGTLNKKGYYQVGINYKYLAVHRIIWIMFYGDIPEGLEVDHIFHNTLDNRIENLRLVTHIENSKNQPKRKTNKSGYANIFLYKRSKKKPWAVKISNYCKYFSTLEKAIQHRNEKYIEFGFHENHGL